MDKRIEQLITIAREKISSALSQTEYSGCINEIVEDYAMFIRICTKKGLITNEESLEVFRIDSVEHFDGDSYASWLFHNLTLQKRFFVERTKEERRNVLFHELIHSLMEKLFSYSNLYYNNFLNYIMRLDENLASEHFDVIRKRYADIFTDQKYERNAAIVFEAMQTFNEATTQYLAELLTNYSYGRPKKESTKFDSKIMTQNDHFKSFFVTYPEYEQLFINFLRTLNGFGSIEDNDELFYKWFDELKSGYIWDRIIGTYNCEQSKGLLLEFLAGFGAVRLAKESCMEIGIEYQGDRSILTNNLINLDLELIKNRNHNDNVIFSHEIIPDLPAISSTAFIAPRKHFN